MKMLIIGVGIVLCGVMMICTDVICKSIIFAIMSGVSSVEWEILSLRVLGYVVIALGLIISLWGYREDK